MQWFLHTLAKDVSLQSKVREAVLKNPSDFESPLVRASLREVLRLYPVAPFISRIVDSDVTLGEYRVPKGKRMNENFDLNLLEYLLGTEKLFTVSNKKIS